MLQLAASFGGEVRLDLRHGLDREARVELYRLGERVAEGYTAEDGSFRFEGLTPGPYLLVVRYGGQSEFAEVVNIAGRSSGHDIRVLLNGSQGPVAGAATVSVVSKALQQSDKYLEKKRYADAERVLQDAIRNFPSAGDAYFALARVYFEQNRLNDAIAMGRMAHAKPHRAAAVHLILAKSYSKLGDESSVITELQTFLREAPEQHPARADARKALSMLLSKQP